MKISLKKKKVRATKKRGRPSLGIGGKPVMFYPGLEVLDDIVAVKKEYLAANIKKPIITRSFVFREGARLYLAQLRADLKKAQNGELHAKKRRN